MQRIPRPLTDADRADRAINLRLERIGDLGPAPRPEVLRYAAQGTVLQELADRETEAAATVAATPSMLPINDGPRMPRAGSRQAIAAAIEQQQAAHAVGYDEGAIDGHELARREVYRDGYWWGFVCGSLNSAVLAAGAVSAYAWLAYPGA